MKLLLENWRNFINEEAAALPDNAKKPDLPAIVKKGTEIVKQQPKKQQKAALAQMLDGVTISDEDKKKVAGEIVANVNNDNEGNDDKQKALKALVDQAGQKLAVVPSDNKEKAALTLVKQIKQKLDLGDEETKEVLKVITDKGNAGGDGGGGEGNPNKIGDTPEEVQQFEAAFDKFKNKFYCDMEPGLSRYERKKSLANCQDKGIAITKNQQHEIIKDLIVFIEGEIEEIKGSGYERSKLKEPKVTQDKPEVIGEQKMPRTEIAAYKQDLKMFIRLAKAASNNELGSAQKFAGKRAGKYWIERSKKKMKQMLKLCGTLYEDLRDLSGALGSASKKQKPELKEMADEVERVYDSVVNSLEEILGIAGEHMPASETLPRMEKALEELESILRYFPKGRVFGKGKANAEDIRDKYDEAVKLYLGDNFAVLMNLPNEIPRGGATAIQGAAQQVRAFAEFIARMFGLEMPKQFDDPVETKKVEVPGVPDVDKAKKKVEGPTTKDPDTDGDEATGDKQLFEIKSMQDWRNFINKQIALDSSIRSAADKIGVDLADSKSEGSIQLKTLIAHLMVLGHQSAQKKKITEDVNTAKVHFQSLSGAFGFDKSKFTDFFVDLERAKQTDIQVWFQETLSKPESRQAVALLIKALSDVMNKFDAQLNKSLATHIFAGRLFRTDKAKQGDQDQDQTDQDQDQTDQDQGDQDQGDQQQDQGDQDQDQGDQQQGDQDQTDQDQDQGDQQQDDQDQGDQDQQQGDQDQTDQDADEDTRKIMEIIGNIPPFTSDEGKKFSDDTIKRIQKTDGFNDDIKNQLENGIENPKSNLRSGKAPPWTKTGLAKAFQGIDIEQIYRDAVKNGEIGLRNKKETNESVERLLREFSENAYKQARVIRFLFTTEVFKEHDKRFRGSDLGFMLKFNEKGKVETEEVFKTWFAVRKFAPICRKIILEYMFYISYKLSLKDEKWAKVTKKVVEIMNKGNVMEFTFPWKDPGAGGGQTQTDQDQEDQDQPDLDQQDGDDGEISDEERILIGKIEDTISQEFPQLSAGDDNVDKDKIKKQVMQLMGPQVVDTDTEIKDKLPAIIDKEIDDVINPEQDTGEETDTNDTGEETDTDDTGEEDLEPSYKLSDEVKESEGYNLLRSSWKSNNNKKGFDFDDDLAAFIGFVAPLRYDRLLKEKVKKGDPWQQVTTNNSFFSPKPEAQKKINKAYQALDAETQAKVDRISKAMVVSGKAPEIGKKIGILRSIIKQEPKSDEQEQTTSKNWEDVVDKDEWNKSEDSREYSVALKKLKNIQRRLGKVNKDGPEWNKLIKQQKQHRASVKKIQSNWGFEDKDDLKLESLISALLPLVKEIMRG